MTINSISRGDACIVDFGDTVGSVQSGIRPAVVLQNNIGNRHSSTVIVAPMTKSVTKAHLPTHVSIRKGDGGVLKNSMVLTEQIIVIDKSQIDRIIGRLSNQTMDRINQAVRISLAL